MTSSSVTVKDIRWKKFHRDMEALARGPHVKVGILEDKGSAPKKDRDGGTAKADLVTIATVHEFGATILHPGGTPYMIAADGTAVFLPKGDPRAVGVTEPHVIQVPERSFIRATLDQQRGTIERATAKLMGQVLDGSLEPEAALGKLGMLAEILIKRRIQGGIDPPNAASTARRKGSAKTLIDTGQMINAVSFLVVWRQ